MKKVIIEFIDGWRKVCQDREDEIARLVLALVDCCLIPLNKAVDLAEGLYEYGVRVVYENKRKM